MDKFSMYFAFNEGNKGKTLTRNAATHYNRQAKLSLHISPRWKLVCSKLGKRLDNFCVKRYGGSLTNKAPPLLVYLYVNASCSSGFLDAALLCMQWYLSGRASDLALLLKPNTPIDAGYVLFTYFVWMKTSEEQGLSLFS
ncbi:hypothetical protein PHPALM_28965 [Phytophthora palmivora]|uniref:Uncharacterized protein n=1 Tax=Phytophthora palmivora TaxID=4796 RepID=A0A2P4X8R6_9STRA|nr:hypothetical protein PHPALM_28965 [Phytophthora palmivora]